MDRKLFASIACRVELPIDPSPGQIREHGDFLEWLGAKCAGNEGRAADIFRRPRAAEYDAAFERGENPL